MMTKPNQTIIYGAGLAGLIAGCQFQSARIVEAGASGSTNHKAVLRFRSSAVGDAVGIEFHKVRVRKGIWYDEAFVQPNIQLANWYAQKVIGTLVDRSIWDIEPVDRYIAPEDLMAQLIARCEGRISWDFRVTPEVLGAHLQERRHIISTLPMSVMAQLLQTPDVPAFHFAPITVRRYRLARADVFQTIYFPDPATTLYRVSITGSLMIAEYAGAPDDYNFMEAFGINKHLGVHPIDVTHQGFGKIAPVEDDAWRTRFIYALSHQHNIFSLGRFGTWRNLLLDDVLKDCQMIKRLMNSTSYERSKINAIL